MSFQNTPPISPPSAPMPPPPGPGGPPSSLARAMAQTANEMTVVYFTASIVALATILITSHFANNLLMSSRPQRKDVLGRRLIVTTRFVRNGMLHRVPFFNTLGHALVFAAYFVINIALILQNLDLTQSRNWAKRLGWITTCNIGLITFLALKNTPLAFLATYSYERLNILHQAAGYCTVFFTILHALLWIVTWAENDHLQGLLELDNVMGIIAGFAMLSMLSTALILKRVRYEAFYIVHITMFMLILITAGMHRPDLVTKSTYVIIFAAGIWVSDRILRGSRMLWYSFSNRVTIHPLPQGGVRITMRRTPWRAVPGTHVFLWIPKARAIETHPFTIISTNPLELVVSAQNGFTKDLYSLASKTPGVVLRASCDGPYGTIPNFAKFDQVVLVAGGSGATFTLGVALKLIRKMSPGGARPVIHFIWVVRDQEAQSWFEKELTELAVSPLVTLTIYVTRSIGACTPPEKQAPNEVITRAQSFEKSETDPEKAASGSCSPTSPTTDTLPTMLSRPDISTTIRSILSVTSEEERTIVAACGPVGLMKDVRDVVGDVVVDSGRSVAFHCEQFGW
ncbi:related to ferric-chelate reductase [Phialocephala subalpina]|uniref:Related to ferric-chelate reductase n=1 Tax=Phialocephala subalpina TaxID=576137 RepID=A0A1L7X0S4_9HELO|nr:related to ferric-chelate reductase [Phialocephala subalpina]